MRKKSSADKALKIRKVSQDYTDGFIDGIMQGEEIGIKLAVKMMKEMAKENNFNLKSDQMKK